MGTEPAAPEWEVPASRLLEFAPKRTRCCIAVPVINEGERIRGQLHRMHESGVTAQADLLILDGGSTDGSLVPDELRAHGVRALLVKTGPGRLGAQLRMGYAWALQQGYAGIVTVDGNGKDGVEAIPLFLDKLDAGYDLIQGSRYIPGGRAIHTPRIRALAIKLIHVPVINRAAGFRFTDTTNGFRGYSRRYLLDPRVQPFRGIFSSYELLAYLSVRGPQLGMKTVEVPVTRQYPPSGKTVTRISPFKGNLTLLRILVETWLGRYDPPAGAA
ncbi:MAG TPA: glycosyltransferase family 2 protein [Candidatus Polarisedimenticolaceae bacterium]|nr:glycosyltransferase family 2 protein [Candidatus Polarisedimenticolaceae bacterium]